jgi:hypothetical protein
MVLSVRPISPAGSCRPPDHPITAPGYSARRSAMAKEIGLGLGRKTANAAPPAEPEPAPTTSVKTGRDQ